MQVSLVSPVIWIIQVSEEECIHCIPLRNRAHWTISPQAKFVKNYKYDYISNNIGILSLSNLTDATFNCALLCWHSVHEHRRL